MSANFSEALKTRRSVYGISKDIPVSEARIEEVIGEAVKHTPSAFNSQSARVVVLFGEQHDKLWTIVKETLRKIVPADNFSSTEQKLASFQSGYGTVLFFEDQAVVEGLQEQFALYKDNFPVWSNQSSGMLQFVVWTALAAEGIGASLQHYNPLIDDEVKQTWSLPASWKLIAQLPFGAPTAEPGDKAFSPVEDRLKVFK
ncbi:nitroreductase family protein [Gorillibacterium timonense]|uniref:nitroreductase family protein n=1 Tax=Gorillibacterium timonense TaxID=1689269 RepID=UPI00071D98F0|nr:nitroreductase family protein [Gorillibacterium timonense]